jgi:hypothetical protein
MILKLALFSLITFVYPQNNGDLLLRKHAIRGQIEHEAREARLRKVKAQEKNLKELAKSYSKKFEKKGFIAGCEPIISKKVAVFLNVEKSNNIVSRIVDEYCIKSFENHKKFTDEKVRAKKNSEILTKIVKKNMNKK